MDIFFFFLRLQAAAADTDLGLSGLSRRKKLKNKNDFVKKIIFVFNKIPLLNQKGQKVKNKNDFFQKIIFVFNSLVK